MSRKKEGNEWKILETLLSLSDIDILAFLPKSTKTSLLCTSTTVFGLTYPKLLKAVVWDLLVKKRSYSTLTTSLHILCNSGSPFLSSVHIPWVELNKYLLIEAEHGRPQKIRSLLHFGAKVNESLPGNFSIPQTLSPNPNSNSTPPPAVQWNLYKDPTATPTMNTLTGHTALHLAAVGGNATVVDLLVQIGADTRLALSGDQRIALDLAAREGHRDAVLVLVRKGLETAQGNLAEFGKTEEVAEIIMQLGSKMDLKEKYTLLHALAAYDSDESPAAHKADLLVQLGVRMSSESQSGSTPLHFAAKLGRTTVVKQYLQLGAKLHSQTNKGLLPMHLAAKWGHLETTKLLLDEGSAVDARTFAGDTALHLAGIKGRVEVVRLLLARGADKESINNGEVTPLQDVANAGHADVVRVLIDNGALIEHSGSIGSTALHIAAYFGRTETVRLLIDRGANPDVEAPSKDRPLHSAASEGHTDVVALLLASKVTVDPKNSEGGTPLTLAAKFGHSEVVKLLVGAGANVDAMSAIELPPLCQALNRAHVEVAKLLIKLGANVRAAERASSEVHLRPIIRQASNLDGELVRMLVARGATVQSDFVVHFTERNWEGVVEALVDSGADKEVCDADSNTPLHRAARSGLTSLAEMLINKGANMEARDKYEQTPLFHALIHNHPETMEMFIKKGANIEAKAKGETLLEMAISHEKAKIANMLITSGAVLTGVYEGMMTVLHLAAMQRMGSTVKLLLEKGANIRARNHHGETPLDTAMRVRNYFYNLKDETRVANANEVIDIIAANQYPEGK